MRFFKKDYGPAWALFLSAIALMVYVLVEYNFTVFVRVSMNGIVLGLTYLLVALGLALMWGVMHLLNFAHGQFFMMGAFSVWYFMVRVDVLTKYLPIVPAYLISLVLAMVIVGMMGTLVERYLFRRFGGDLLPALLISLGLGLILAQAMILAFGLLTKSIPTAFAGSQRFFGVSLTNERLALVISALVLLVALWWLVSHTKFGRAMVAIREDQTAAALQGIDIGKFRLIVMFIGSALAAVAGGLYGPVFQVTPEMGTGPMATAFAIIVLGGLGSLPGAGIAAFFLGFVESFGATFLGATIAQFFTFAVIILVLIFKPTGLFGHGGH